MQRWLMGTVEGELENWSARFELEVERSFPLLNRPMTSWFACIRWRRFVYFCLTILV